MKVQKYFAPLNEDVSIVPQRLLWIICSTYIGCSTAFAGEWQASLFALAKKLHNSDCRCWLALNKQHHSPTQIFCSCRLCLNVLICDAKFHSLDLLPKKSQFPVDLACKHCYSGMLLPLTYPVNWIFLNHSRENFFYSFFYQFIHW